ncbi:Chromate transporter [Rhodopseudomonas palustris BisB5]|uniref:Chromate transporter n=1 Tax=Rhodopseudomonas palustris (strain BisB5) TaxID=316057 RepID=Q13EW0_RHOPS|nr:Chromate transporter [Rhodopseudomonas palustris BisB5]
MSSSASQPRTTDSAAPGVSLAEATSAWAKIALLSFGGPAGQIAVMHRIVVDEKRWVSEERFLHALNYCMLLPGPEAQQLATYLGWLMHGTRGGLIAGGLFILPGALAIMVLSVIYVSFGQLGIVAALFFGLKAAVLAIVLQAVSRVGARALKTSATRALAALALLAIFVFDVPFPLIVLGAGLIGWLGSRAGLAGFSPPTSSTAVVATNEDGARVDAVTAAGGTPGEALRVALVWLVLWLTPVAALLIGLGPDNVFSQLAVFFSKMALVTFGGAYAVLAYVAQLAVDHYGWLKPGEMLDGLGMAETTPGPLIMVLQFVGFVAAFRTPGALPPLVAGALGGLLTTWVTFAPCFLWIFLGAPYVERLRGNAALSAALAAITAAVVGVMLNLALWFAIHTIFREVRKLSVAGLTLELPVLSSINPSAALLSALAIVAVFGFRMGTATVLLICASAGFALHFLGAL